MKYKLRAIVSKISSFTEIFLSVLILVGIIVASADAIRLLIELFPTLGPLQDTMAYFNIFLSFTIQLIIGVELVKMIAKHTPTSAVEVLLFVIAKRLIIDTGDSVEVLYGVIAIAILFGVRKFFFLPNKINNCENFIYEAFISAEEFSRLTGIRLPGNMGITIGQIVENELKRLGLKLEEGAQVVLDGYIFRVVDLSQSNEITKLRVLRLQNDEQGNENKGFRKYVRNYF